MSKTFIKFLKLDFGLNDEKPLFCEICSTIELVFTTKVNLQNKVSQTKKSSICSTF